MYKPLRPLKKLVKGLQQASLSDITRTEIYTGLAEATALSAVLLAGGYWSGVYRFPKGFEPVIEIPQTEADSIFNKFPVQIPGAAKISKYGVSGSSQCLVHIKQVHLFEGISEERKGRVKQVQADIYTILSYLIDNLSLKDVYIEALSSDLVKFTYLDKDARGILPDKIREEAEDVLRKYLLNPKHEDPLKRKEYIETLENFISDLKADEERIKKSDLFKGILERVEKDFNYNAAGRLFREGKIKLREAETLAGNEKAGKKYLSGSEQDMEFQKLVMDDREDIALKLISEGKLGLSVIVYGFAHSWKNNVGEWNRNNRNKFSLVEIVPEAYLRLYGSD